eukprot:8151674-Pyramimonas_sp.AAC.1
MVADSFNSFGHSVIPTWNGDPSKWRDYYQEVELWKLSENLSVTQSLASKLVLRLTGTARSAALTMTEVQLDPAPDPNIEDADEKKRDRNQVGIENVLQHLEASL